MPKAYRRGDLDTGHDGRPATPATEASDDVWVNGARLVRQGDALAEHGCATGESKGRVVAAGSGTVFVNSRAAARSGDPISCGGFADEGSDDVSIGD
nr:PAAR domain-containing protein [uncultured Paracoccus sp.]